MLPVLNFWYFWNHNRVSDSYFNSQAQTLLRHGTIVQLRDAVKRAIGVRMTETGRSKLSVSTNSFKDKEEM